MSQLPGTPQSTGLRRLVVILAGVVVIGGAVYLYGESPHRRAVPAPTPPGAPSDEDDIHRALRLAGIDTTKKNEYVDEIPGVDVSPLTAAQRTTFVRLANARRCTCGCGFTLAACRRFDSTCEISGPRVDSLLAVVAGGLVR